jgi:hypothetical protein
MYKEHNKIVPVTNLTKMSTRILKVMNREKKKYEFISLNYCIPVRYCFKV